jgi:hypothetical protein
MPSRDFSENRQPIHTMIQDAIGSHLARKGVARTDQNGDVMVAYLVIVGNNATTESINDYFGYGRDADALAFKAHKAYTSDNKNPNYFEAGTLIIDLVDGRTFELLFRTHVTRPVLQNVPLDARQANIQGAVDEALKGLKISG